MLKPNCFSIDRKLGIFYPLIFTMICLAIAFPAHAGKIYTIQVAAAKTNEEAAACQKEFAKNYSPVFIRQVDSKTGYPFKVCIGYFEYFVDAWVCRNQLKETIKDSLISGFENEDVKSTQNTIPLTLPFVTQGLNAPGASPERSVENMFDSLGIRGGKDVNPVLLSKAPIDMTREELISVGMNGKKNQDGISALDQFLKNYPNDSESNKIRLRLVRRLFAQKNFDKIDVLINQVKANGNDDEKSVAELFKGYKALYNESPEEACGIFTSIAGNKDLPPSIRRDAMRRASGCAHTNKDYPVAWLMFDQIEKNAASVKESSEARMEKAGLAYELVLRGVGPWEDVLRLCRSVREMPGAPRNVIATADLMYLEALYYDGKISEALNETEKFLADYKDIPREYFTAMKWRGIFLVKLSQYDEAEKILLDLLDQDIKDNQKFANHDPRADAALWLAWIAQQKDDTDKKNHYLNILNVQYPGYKAQKEADKLFKSAK